MAQKRGIHATNADHRRPGEDGTNPLFCRPISEVDHEAIAHLEADSSDLVTSPPVPPPPTSNQAESLHAPLLAYLASRHPSTPPPVLDFCAWRLLSRARPFGVDGGQGGQSGCDGEDEGTKRDLHWVPVQILDPDFLVQRAQEGSLTSIFDRGVNDHRRLLAGRVIDNRSISQIHTGESTRMKDEQVNDTLVDEEGSDTDYAKGNGPSRVGQSTEEKIEEMYAIARESWRLLERIVPSSGAAL